MSSDSEAAKPQTTRDNSSVFGFHFSRYINGWVATAIVLPAAITWKGMPVYESQRGILLTYSTLSCALTLAFLFTSREFIPKAKSRIGRIGSILIPLILIFLTAICATQYYEALSHSVSYYENHVSLSEAMQSYPIDRISRGDELIFNYVLTVVFAECAFFFMAFREWQPSTVSSQIKDSRA
jgi:hypothetical protein